MTKYYRILLSLLLISSYLIDGAPTMAPISLPADDALSTYYCIDSPAWSEPSFLPKNCATAMSQFFVQEMLVHGDVVFEFHAVGAQPRSRYPSQHTPQKFTYEQLPGVPPATMFGLTDVASYSDAWNAVKRVKNNCISEYLATNETIHESGGGMNFRSLTGWSATGTLHLLRTLGESVADVKYVLQEAKALLVSSYGTQIRK
ncbi:hypothetical protein HO133_009027 [Letharia lupina]|uniref:Uncharacterized protein n=1 Tax=Letharia lupina TaxID=560253 RepID=A0A8H6FFF8_9LECA|nr:uncharacterized protein HO133_009027 [Letharia lupina]KAF6226161.1 hypothetical protein HO133_009027 [Letharia lupina]